MAWVLMAGGVVFGGCGDDAQEGEPVDAGPVECAVLTLPEAARAEQVEIVNVVPTGTGGALRDGDYELVGHVRYRTTPLDEEPSFMRAALRLRRRATVMDYLFDEGAAGEPASPSGFTARVTANANVLLLQMVCPEGRTTALGYTASGDSLSLIEEDEEMRFALR